MKTIEELKEDILAFRDERNWKQFHTPKDLAISISLEAAELLEVFQWSGDDLVVKDKREKIEEELADVLIYCGLMADAVGLNVDEIITKKLQTNREKYPVEKAYGKSDKYTELK
ncbi:MAG: nucleotide pyrophosphohydrolase [Lachnospiraceae bacterium]|nr:nucleotide pyrophosphohydrolase [Lachnospiraceae bacterium]